MPANCSGACHISGVQTSGLVVDHCHIRMLPRGLVSNSVNVRLPRQYHKMQCSSTLQRRLLGEWWNFHNTLGTTSFLKNTIAKNVELIKSIRHRWEEAGVTTWTEKQWGLPDGTFEKEPLYEVTGFPEDKIVFFQEPLKSLKALYPNGGMAKSKEDYFEATTYSMLEFATQQMKACVPKSKTYDVDL
ncbi:hypothetical protein ABW19_dt0210168 [Dactylella cylindrospora]|nr:hypothetical protein ABW19_dt0210168 [Dactylella cylindrospora]